MNTITPIFPCQSLDELLAFYESLGFAVTYRQKSPNPYAVLERGWIRLDFYALKNHVPGRCYHVCYINTLETDALYEAFSSALRRKNGKLPTRGLPRISELRDKSYGIREFTLTDIAGNYLKIGRPLSKTEAEVLPAAIAAASERLSLALNYAYKCEGEADEVEKVTQVLDKAIERDGDKHCRNLFKVMTLRADMAIAQGDITRAKALLDFIRDSPSIRNHPEHFKTELERVADIEQKLDLDSNTAG